MSDNTHITAAILMGIPIGIITAIPVVNSVNLFCCLPLILASAGAVTIPLLRNKTTTMTTQRAAITGLMTGVVATLVDYVFSLSLYLTLELVFGEAPQAATEGAGNLLEALGVSAAGVMPMVLWATFVTLIFGLTSVIVGPLSAVLTLHIFHKNRITETHSEIIDGSEQFV